MLSSAAYSSYLVPVLGGSTDTENAFDEEPDTNEIKNRNCVWLLWTFADWKIFSPKVLKYTSARGNLLFSGNNRE